MTTHIGDIFAKLFISGSNPVTSTIVVIVRLAAFLELLVVDLLEFLVVYQVLFLVEQVA